MKDRTLVSSIAAPLVVAVLLSSWLLWTRSAPHRQGGYCMNASVEIAGVLQRADTSGDVGRGPLPPVGKILAEVDQVDVTRFQVNTPPEVQDDVDLLVAERDPAAFARIAQDYLERCRKASTE
ncbi:MAG TPA: hypothetical protein VNQ33_04420 [Acidimicrobiales bacterium]|nr:hypothetical protein [Acidimicrobiales bacterium]